MGRHVPEEVGRAGLGATQPFPFGLTNIFKVRVKIFLKNNSPGKQSSAAGLGIETHSRILTSGAGNYGDALYELFKDNEPASHLHVPACHQTGGARSICGL